MNRSEFKQSVLKRYAQLEKQISETEDVTEKINLRLEKRLIETLIENYNALEIATQIRGK